MEKYKAIDIGAERNSSFELLRIVCMIGIVIMHVNGVIMPTCTGVNLLWCHLENGIFQIGVSVFVLISGYFGISSSVRKVVRLEQNVLFYSLLSGILSYIFLRSSFVELLKSFLPISTNKYWFLSCYMILMIFSPFLNAVVERMEKRKFEKLLLLLLGIFYVLPTFVYYDVLQQSGKSVINMLVLYMLGGYIRKWERKKYSLKYLILCLGITWLFSIGVNVCSSYITGGIGAHIPMSRDCSIFVVIESVCVFLIFKRFKFYSKMINYIAKHVVAVYMFEGAFRALFTTLVYDWNIFNQELYWWAISVVVALFVFVCCVLVDIVKSRALDILRNKVELIILKNKKIQRCGCEIINRSKNEIS